MNASQIISTDVAIIKNVKSNKSFIDTIPQSYLLICILILFILFFILILIILICLIKKRKKFLQSETIVNNNIDINKMILQNSKSKDFQAIPNNSNASNYSIGINNLSLNELKHSNLKEEIHNIVSETLSEMSLNKARRLKRKKVGNQKRKIGPINLKIESNNEGINKELNPKI